MMQSLENKATGGSGQQRPPTKRTPPSTPPSTPAKKPSK